MRAPPPIWSGMSLTMRCRADKHHRVRHLVSPPELPGTGTLDFDKPIWENIDHTFPAAIMSANIPKAMAEKFAAITTLTDAFSAKYLNEEYRQMIHKLVGVLARKRPSPLVRGKESVWAAAAVHALGRVNFLDDSSQTPHCKAKVIYEFFEIGESTGQNKSKEVRDLLKMGPMSPEWTLPSRLSSNPLVWMLQVNGLIVDIRGMPIALQRTALEKGLTPYIPVERNEKTA